MEVLQMKYLIKTILLFFIVLLTSCSSTHVIENTTDKPSIDIQMSSNEIITIPICTDYIPSEDTARIMNKILEDKYNIVIEYTLKKNVSQADIANFDGLVFISRDKFFEYFPNRTEIMLPMTDNLSKIEEWNYQPDRFKKAFSQFDNENWAIPASEPAQAIFPVRAYNSDMLLSLQSQTPLKIEEMAELLEKVKENYSSITPMLISGYSVLYYSADILNAFGVPVFFCGNDFSQITYDESIGGYKDIVMDDNFMKAITFMKNLYLRGLIKIAEYSDRTILKLFNEGLVFTRFGRPPVSDDEICKGFSPVYGSYLLNDDYDLSHIYHNDTPGLIVLGGETKEPQKILNALIVNFYSSQEGIRDVSYGLMELSDYKMTDDSIFKSLATQNIKFLPINISSLLDEPEYSEMFNNKQALSDLLELKMDYMISIPIANQPQNNNFYHAYVSQYVTSKEAMFKALNSLVIKYIETNMSSEEFMENYLIEMKKINAEEIINEFNKALGLTEFAYMGE